MALKVPSERALLEAIESGELAIEAASLEVIEALRRAVGNYSYRLNALLNETIRDPSKLPKLSEARDVAGQLADALRDAGLDEVVKTFERRFRNVEKAALEYFGEFRISKTRAGVDRDTLNALVAQRRQDFLDLADKRLVQPAANAITDALIGRRDRDQLLRDITATVREKGITTHAGKEFSDTQIETLVNDSFRRHARVTKALKAESLGLEIVWFQGPLDRIASPQCRFMLTAGEHGVPNMWLREEFTRASLNGRMGKELLREEPIHAGGHWGCRHNVNVVTAGFAASKGFRVPKEVPSDRRVETKDKKL